ncbi:MAG: tRNA (guanosine(46)-N7)-methyltransferase TrmB [Chlorobi bacterium]|nr:tRNA (guanosine(46)-N7)-methyltransferase TrmB [Chlorobiota bacterium]
MGKNKLQRFAENKTFPHFFEPTRDELLKGRFPLRGKWRSDFFKNDRPLVLELGCGKGDYTVALARRFPDRNFIGIDIKGARMWRGAKTALEEGLPNVAFLRMQIELIDKAFAPGEVNEIWLTFPDPQMKYKRTKHRLTNPAFLERYRRILVPEHEIHLKTDSEFLYGYTLGILEASGHDILYAHHDIYNNRHAPPLATEIQTFYEQKWLDEGKKITYLRFRLRPDA